MGWLGICLFLAGITLSFNGFAAFVKMDAKSSAFINILTGLFVALGSLISLLKINAADIEACRGIAAGFLFCFTYFFIAANYLWKLDKRAFGFFSIGAVCYSVINAASYFSAGAVIMAVLWLLWALLWLESFLEFSLGIKAMEKVFPALAVFEGVFATGIPGLMMLFGVWPG